MSYTKEMRQKRSLEEIWLEVQRLVRSYGGPDVVVPLPYATPGTKSDSSWAMSLVNDRWGVLGKAVATAQLKWDLRVEHAVRRPVSAELLHALLMKRISALPRIAARMPVLHVCDIVWIADALPGETNWAVLSVTAKRNSRADVAAVIWAAQHEFELVVE